MTAPEHSPLPWVNKPRGEHDYGSMRDANDDVIEIYSDDHGEQIRSRIVTAVNSHAALLAAAKEALATAHDESFPVYVFDQLRAAIAAAEELAP